MTSPRLKEDAFKGFCSYFSCPAIKALASRQGHAEGRGRAVRSCGVWMAAPFESHQLINKHQNTEITSTIDVNKCVISAKVCLIHTADIYTCVGLHFCEWFRWEQLPGLDVLVRACRQRQHACTRPVSFFKWRKLVPSSSDDWPPVASLPAGITGWRHLSPASSC